MTAQNSIRIDPFLSSRTYLFVPGDRPDFLNKLEETGADAIIIDLEDAVAPARKGEARQLASHWVGTDRQPAVQIWVRVNAGENGEADIECFRDLPITGLMLPKAQTQADVARCAYLARANSRLIPLIVLIETAPALRAINEIAEHEAVVQLMIGEADLGADSEISSTSTIWDCLRAQVVIASAAARIASPIGPVDPDFKSPEEFEKETRRLRDMGFGARAVIHPSQVEPAHRAFRPSRREVEEARRLLEAHDKSLDSGRAVYLGESGVMVDEAFVRSARKVLERARRYR